MQQIADEVWLGTGTDVNWVVVRDGSDLTLVDSGYPKDTGKLAASLAAIGHTTGDIRAVLLTHAHVDHIGGLNDLWEQHRTPVLMHPEEVAIARGDRREQATPLDVALRSWRPRIARWSTRIMRAGALDHPRIAHAEAWDSEGQDSEALDLPGAPVPVPCPGHTSGSTAYLFPAAGVLATGDALVTAHPVSGKSIPHRLPAFFSHDPALAERSLSTLGAVEAAIVAPGHGPVWTEGVRRAAEIAAS